MTAARIAIGIVGLVGLLILGLASSLVSSEIVEKVNDRLPKEQQFAPLWWYWPRTRRLWQEYTRLYPDGALLRKLRTLGVLAFACLVTSGWAIGLFGR